MLNETLKRHWWVPVLRGILAILFGIIAFAYPGLTAATLVIFFGAWILVDGVFRIIAAIGHRASDPEWGFHLIIGILGIIVGLLLWNPLLGAATLIWLIAWYAIVFGILGIILGFRLRSLPTIPVR